MIRLQNLRLPLDYTEDTLRQAAADKLRIPVSQIREIRLRRRSVDARRREVTFLLTVDLTVQGERQLLRRPHKDVLPVREHPYRVMPCRSHVRPVVIGYGPGGIFAAYILALAGLRPLVLERGCCVEERLGHVRAFREGGLLREESNVQFGEGGAGTFSDGKLHTGIKDPHIRFILETFAACGAPEEILWQAKPHIGTDRLPGTVRELRRRTEALGAEIRFGCKLTALVQHGGRLTAIRYVREGREEELPVGHLVLAIGHSARDTYEMLHAAGLPLAQKPFAIGVRIEHLQEQINLSRYGAYKDHPALGAAEYKLAVHLPQGRSLYTFCMCPGGEVVAAASEPGRLAVNGMSCFARSGRNANSALLVGITPDDLESAHPLAGMTLQRQIEQAAYRAGGGGYAAPVIRVGDFLQCRESTAFGSVLPTYLPGTAFASPDSYLPAYVCETLRRGIPELDRQLAGFAAPDALLTGVESRSSSPVRILRDEHCCSLGMRGLYPCGEGAGYAGGITSAAADGIRCAEAIIRELGGEVWNG